MSDWDTRKAEEVYGTQRWGAGYFRIGDNGDLMVDAPVEAGSQSVSLREVVEGLQERGLEMPVMLRLENLVGARIRELNEQFQDAISGSGYQGEYRGVFPIKVNQQSHVIEEITRYGKQFDHGLEAGSKAELLIALAMLGNDTSMIICNGYKDEEFINLGLQAVRLGIRCFFVVETPKELEIIIERSQHWEIKPYIGLRLKLSTSVEGHWADDNGDRSLFGLGSMQLIEVIDRLKAVGMMDCLQLLHYHLGSQIPNIRNIRDGVREACRYYINISQEGANLKYLDLGGGLAIDYDGTGNGGYSCNYSLQEYCMDIVEGISESLDRQGVAHPDIITESGRATVAHMSVLLFNILDVTSFDPGKIEAPMDEASDPVRSLWETWQGVSLKRLQECYNDAFYYRDQAREAFRRGLISLREMATADNLYLAILHKVNSQVPDLRYPSAELEQLGALLADIYYGNFSVFQSLPDAWAIQQVFPVMPIQRLHEEPLRQATIADLTCDCDGKLNNFIGQSGSSKTVPLHELKDNEDYIVGVFLVGAYQETLGDLHNLFGDTNIASVRIEEDGAIDYVHELEGDSIADVLSYVEYDPKQLYRNFQRKAERAVRTGGITLKQRQYMLKLFNESLAGYTYFEL